MFAMPGLGEGFTAEAQSSQSSEYLLVKKLFTLRPQPVLSNVEGRLSGALPESLERNSIG